MVVTCTNCQAKFRVPDERIGARGAKVRCSRCQTVFVVKPAAGAIPAAPPAPPAGASELELEARSQAVRAPRAENPFAVPALAPTRRAPAPDPFARAQPADPLGAAPAADPFAPPPQPDPFASPAYSQDPFAAPHAPDPFAAAPAPDPFAAPGAARSSLPVTDLSDLLGTKPATPPPQPEAAPDPFAAPASAPPPLPAAPDPFAAPPPLPAPAAAADPFADAAARAASPAASGSELALEAPSGPVDRGALSLEEPTGVPPGAPPLADDAATPFESVGGTLDVASSSDAVPAPIESGPDAGHGGLPLDRDAFDLGGTAGESLQIAGEDAREPAFVRAAAPPPRAAPPPAPPPPVAAPPARERLEAVERIPGGRSSRIRSVAVNAVALVALLAVTLTLWAVWRSEGPLDAASLRPAALLASLGRGASAGPWAAVDVRSGVYERERAPPIVFVRGRVVSHAPAPVRGVRVAVELVRGEEVIARGEALAGAVPSAEELHGAVDPVALASVVAAARTRAPAQVRPGDAVPFLVAVGEVPADVEGAAIRVELGPVGGAAP